MRASDAEGAADHPARFFQQALAGVGQLDAAQGRATDFRSYNSYNFV